MITREEDALIREFLAAVGAIPGIHAQRVHVLKVRLPGGAWLQSTTPGTADVYVLMQGKEIWTEWKTPRGVLEPSQLVWHAAIEAAGGRVWTCRAVRETIERMATLATGAVRRRLLALASSLER